MKRGLDLLPCAMSNSGAIVSVFEYFCLCHSQPVGWTNQFGMAKEQSHSWLSAEESPGPSPCPQIANSPPWSDIPWEWGSLCAKVSPQPWHESKSSSPGCTPQHPLVKTPRARLLQYSNGANKRQHRKTNTSWNGGAGWGRRRKKPLVCRLHKSFLRKWAG